MSCQNHQHLKDYVLHNISQHPYSVGSSHQRACGQQQSTDAQHQTDQETNEAMAEVIAHSIEHESNQIETELPVQNQNQLNMSSLH